MLNEAGRNLRFANRCDAGRVLAVRLRAYAGRLGCCAGVPVACEVARSLGRAFDVFVVCKLGVPQQPELAMGAIASGGVRFLNDDVVRWYRIPRRSSRQSPWVRNGSWRVGSVRTGAGAPPCP